MPSKEQVIQEQGYFFPYHYLDLKSDEHRFFLHLEYLGYLRLVKKLIEPFTGQRVLDAGCGDGRFCFEMCKENVKLVGIDYSPAAIAWAKLFNPGVEFYAQDLKDLNVASAFDVICFIETLEHIIPDQIPSVLALLAQRLKTDGKLIITVPSVKMPLIAKHYQHFSVESLTKALEGHFTVEHVYGTTVSTWRTKLFYVMLEFAGLFFCLRRRMKGIDWAFLFLEDYFYRNFQTGDIRDAKRIVAVCKKVSQ